jgi:hypothetical protein
MFALAQILKETGSSLWATGKLTVLLGLDSAQSSKLRSALGRYFPAPDITPVSAYYSLLAALDSAGIEMDIVYFDFIRGIIQLNQYEDLVPDLQETSPKARLEAIVSSRATKLVPEMKLTGVEKLRIAMRRMTSSITRIPHVEGGLHNTRRFFSSTAVQVALLFTLIGVTGHQAYQYPAVQQPLNAAAHNIASMLKTDYEKRLNNHEPYRLSVVLETSTNLAERAAAAKLLKVMIAQDRVDSYRAVTHLRYTSLGAKDDDLRSHAGQALIELIEGNPREGGLLPTHSVSALVELLQQHSVAAIRYGAAAKLDELSAQGYIKPDDVLFVIGAAAHADPEANNRDRLKSLRGNAQETRKRYAHQRTVIIEKLRAAFLNDPATAVRQDAADSLMWLVQTGELGQDAMVDLYIKILGGQSGRNSAQIYEIIPSIRKYAWQLRAASGRLTGVLRGLMGRKQSREIRWEVARLMVSLAEDGVIKREEAARILKETMQHDTQNRDSLKDLVARLEWTSDR